MYTRLVVIYYLLIWCGNVMDATPLPSSQALFFERIHPHAYHKILNITAEGKWAELEDGSIWEVHPLQQEQLLTWHMDDHVIIKPRATCCSLFQYVIHHMAKSETVEVNIVRAPITIHPETFVIQSIDKENKLLSMRDQTIWHFAHVGWRSWSWKVGDTIVIGVNNYWRIAEMPHILINTSVPYTPYIEAEFIGYTSG